MHAKYYAYDDRVGQDADDSSGEIEQCKLILTMNISQLMLSDFDQNYEFI